MTTLSKIKPQVTVKKNKLRARRLSNGEVEIRRYGKWYDLESLRSLAAYKFNSFGNSADLKSNDNYTEYDIQYIQPTFRFSPTRGVIAPTSLFRHIMEEELEVEFECTQRLFVPHPVIYGPKNRSYSNYGCVGGFVEDEWYTFPNHMKYAEMLTHYKHLPFYSDPRFNYIEFTLKQGMFVKWDDDVEQVIGDMTINLDPEFYDPQALVNIPCLFNALILPDLY